jgi:hypothetical protein
MMGLTVMGDIPEKLHFGARPAQAECVREFDPTW